MTKKSSQLASIITKLEGGKSQIKIGDWRQAEKLLCVYEASLRIQSFQNGKKRARNTRQAAFLSLESRTRKFFDLGLKRINKAKSKSA